MLTLGLIGRHAHAYAWTTEDPEYANRRMIDTVSVAFRRPRADPVSPQ